MQYKLILIFLFFLSATLTFADVADGQKELGGFRRIIRGFSAIDTNYIEPQHYNFTVMLQATYNYDLYRLSAASGQNVTLSPDIMMHLGPYVGWRWFFLGYTFDIKNIGFSNNGRKRELALSLYSSQIGVDLFYRRTGSDYKIRNAYMGENVNVENLNGKAFDGINIGITGANLYYIFNHKRFSYPAAFAQSTCQKLSCGSWLAGIGYTHNSLELDYDKLQRVVGDNCSPGTVKIDSGLLFNSVKYYDINFTGGYAYNWVFAKNFLLCVSASLAFAYKHSKGNMAENNDHGFSLNNVNIDGIGRFGIVYNNAKWYVGTSSIVHSYNYRKARFAANNVFGNLNIYVGYNFGRKK